MPSPGEYRFNPDIKAIRVHPVPEDLGRNWPLDLGIVGDEAAQREQLRLDVFADQHTLSLRREEHVFPRGAAQPLDALPVQPIRHADVGR